MATVESERCFARNSQVQILSVAQSIENIPDKERPRGRSTPVPLRQFSGRRVASGRRSGALRRWHITGSNPVVRSRNCSATRVPVAQSGQSTGLRSRVSHVRIVPGTSSRAMRGWFGKFRSRDSLLTERVGSCDRSRLLRLRVIGWNSTRQSKRSRRQRGPPTTKVGKRSSLPTPDSHCTSARSTSCWRDRSTRPMTSSWLLSFASSMPPQTRTRSSS